MEEGLIEPEAGEPGPCRQIKKHEPIETPYPDIECLAGFVLAHGSAPDQGIIDRIPECAVEPHRPTGLGPNPLQAIHCVNAYEKGAVSVTGYFGWSEIFPGPGREVNIAEVQSLDGQFHWIAIMPNVPTIARSTIMTPYETLSFQFVDVRCVPLTRL